MSVKVCVHTLLIMLLSSLSRSSQVNLWPTFLPLKAEHLASVPYQNPPSTFPTLPCALLPLSTARCSATQDSVLSSSPVLCTPYLFPPLDTLYPHWAGLGSSLQLLSARGLSQPSSPAFIWKVSWKLVSIQVKVSLFHTALSCVSQHWLWSRSRVAIALVNLTQRPSLFFFDTTKSIVARSVPRVSTRRCCMGSSAPDGDLQRRNADPAAELSPWAAVDPHQWPR